MNFPLFDRLRQEAQGAKIRSTAGLSLEDTPLFRGASERKMGEALGIIAEIFYLCFGVEVLEPQDDKLFLTDTRTDSRSSAPLFGQGGI